MDCNIVENYVRERDRMCDFVSITHDSSCSECPFTTNGENMQRCAEIGAADFEEKVRIVQDWSDKHPISGSWSEKKVEKVEPVKYMTVGDFVKRFADVAGYIRVHEEGSGFLHQIGFYPLDMRYMNDEFKNLYVDTICAVGDELVLEVKEEIEID